MEKKDALIEFSDVSKSFNKKKILNDISFKIDKGDIFGLLGRSGSGKTTLLKILLGTYRPDSGEVTFRNRDITGDSFYLRKIIGLTTQENSFYDKLSVYENMRYYSSLYDISLSKKELDMRIKNILKEVELESSLNTMAERLSGGMKRRLDFAISLIHDPELLILDEPTTGLDPILVKQFWEIIKKFSKNGKTILVISHIFPEIKENCNRAGILNKGKIKLINITEKTDLYKEFCEAVQ
jgi:ABC-2 type transport system ATP-binding protein